MNIVWWAAVCVAWWWWRVKAGWEAVHCTGQPRLLLLLLLPHAQRTKALTSSLIFLNKFKYAV